MPFPDWNHRVFRIYCDDDPDNKFGTGFVVHVEPKDGGFIAYLVTCAHVLDTCGSNIKVLKQTADRLTAPGDNLDLAVIKVPMDISVGSLSIDTVDQLDCAVEVPGCKPSSTAGKKEFLLFPLTGTLKRAFRSEDRSGLESIPRRQIHLPEETDDIKEGYSGSPVLTEKGVCAVLDARSTVVGEQTYKIGAAFPIWLLAKIWPGMPSKVGVKIFGSNYWPILQCLDEKSDSWTVRQLADAYQTLDLERQPEDFSIWGCAIAIKQFETQDQPVARLCQFITKLADAAEYPELIVCLPIKHLDRKPEVVDETASVPAANKTQYCRLIIRIVEQKLSHRGEKQRGRRYETQIHLTTCECLAVICCCVDCIDCAAAAVRNLKTTFNRPLESVSKSSLAEVIQEEIEDVLESIGETPDLVQIIAPEPILSELAFDSQLDQIIVRGPRRLAEDYPTVFSGERRSDSTKPDGRLLQPRISGSQVPWTGRFAIESNKDVHKRIVKEDDLVGVVTSDAEVVYQCIFSPLPIIAIARDSADLFHQHVSRLPCLRGLPRALHHEQLPVALIYDDPNITIDFAVCERPVIVGN